MKNGRCPLFTPKVRITPFDAKIGGRVSKIEEGQVIECFIKDTENRKYQIGVILYPIDELGKEEGRQIDILFGAPLLEDWGTIIDESNIPPKVDFKHLREGELTELYEKVVQSMGNM